MRPDYTSYSLSELREALSTVDGAKYPENKAALEAELEKRVASGDVEREQRERQEKKHEEEQKLRLFARGARLWIGLYLMGAPLILLNATTQMPAAIGWTAFAILGIVVLYVGVAAIAGFGLWKGKEWGRRLAIGVFAVQLISIQSAFLQYTTVSALSGFFFITWHDFLDFGVSAAIGTGQFRLAAGDLGLGFNVGVNLVAVFIIWLLMKAREPVDDEESGIDVTPGEAPERRSLK